MKTYICNDSFGQRINAGDTVELFHEWEMSTSWTSIVYWNPLDGAFVDAHPGHVKMNMGVHRSLRDFINQEDIRTVNAVGEYIVLKIYCKKIPRYKNIRGRIKATKSEN